MRDADRYAKIVQWSEEDGCFVGRIPDLCDGGCHGPDPKAVFDELCQIAEEWVEFIRRDGQPLPPAMNWVTAHEEDDASAGNTSTASSSRLQRPG